MKTLFLTIAAPFLATLPSIAQDTVYTRTDGPIDGQVTAIIQGDARVEIGNQTLTIRAADIDSILINDEAREEAENINKKSLLNHAFTFYAGGTINNGDIFFGGLDLRTGWKPTPLNNVGIGITFGRVDTSDSNDDYSMTSDFEFCGPDLIYARPHTAITTSTTNTPLAPSMPMPVTTFFLAQPLLSSSFVSASYQRAMPTR